MAIPAQSIHKLHHGQIIVQQHRFHQFNFCRREASIVQHEAAKDVQMLQHIRHLDTLR